MHISRRRLTQASVSAIGVATLLSPRVLRAASKPIKIGVLTDLSGTFSEATGLGDVLGARLAVEDFNKQHPDLAIELVYADMLLKPDVAASIARHWYDQDDVDAIFDLPQSAAAMAVGSIAKDKDKLVIFTSAGVADLSGKFCSPNQIQWTSDLWADANAIAMGLVEGGSDTWYFIVPDYVSGHGAANDAAAAVIKFGGKELGRSVYPFPATTDFSSYLLQAQASGAKVICLANSGDDTANCIKQANEFGIPQTGVKLATVVMQDYIVKSVGLEATQGNVSAMPFVWNMNADTRAFSDRFAPRYRGGRPNYYHAGSYSAVTHYLKTVAAMGVDNARLSGRATAEQMKAMPVVDPLYGKGTVRADGKFIHNMYVWKTKTVAESKEPWDYFTLVSTIPADRAFRSMADGGCPLIKT